MDADRLQYLSNIVHEARHARIICRSGKFGMPSWCVCEVGYYARLRPYDLQKGFRVARMRIRISQSFGPKAVAEMRSLCDSDRADHTMAVRLGVRST